LTVKVPEGMTPLSKEEAEVFERRLAIARQQLEEIDQSIEKELREVRERIATLQDKRNTVLKLYDAACTMLGIENDLAQESAQGPEID
jgi:ElaB/YqjD/DUF883 family membrane-anchored ribosome-binding protein